MKKLMIVVAMMILVLGLSAVAFANNEVKFDVDMNIGAYGVVGNIPNPDGYNNLFGPTITGEAGLYVSDGNATRNFALGNDVWGDWLTGDDVVLPYSDEGTLENPGNVRVAKFFVDSNTNVNVTLEATDWSDWANAPTLFRISSGPHDELTYNPYPAQNANWGTNWAYIYNEVTVSNTNVYSDELEAHNALVDKPGFTVEFEECQGPHEFHINGAMWLPKVGQIAADDYEVELVVTMEIL